MQKQEKEINAKPQMNYYLNIEELSKKGVFSLCA
nr:MAG TPA: hypothetical protein [Bacteriophage sp.]